MPKFTIERAHAHSVEETRTRLQALADKLSSKYGLSSNWTSNNEAEVKGKGATGKIIVAANKVSIMIDLSFALTPLKGRIEEKVQRELESALA